MKFNTARAVHGVDLAYESSADYGSDYHHRDRVAAILRGRRIKESDPATLDYQDFLLTDYWNDLSRYMKSLAEYRCGICKIRRVPWGKGLEVHHKTYAHKGREYPDHLGDLIVLCSACHRDQHWEKSGS